MELSELCWKVSSRKKLSSKKIVTIYSQKSPQNPFKITKESSRVLLLQKYIFFFSNQMFSIPKKRKKENSLCFGSGGIFKMYEKYDNSKFHRLER